MADKRICAICGKVYVHDKSWRATKYCSDKCKREGLRRCESEARKRRKTGIHKVKNTGVSSLAMMARKEGMSYGQYVAKYGC